MRKIQPKNFICIKNINKFCAIYVALMILMLIYIEMTENGVRR